MSAHLFALWITYSLPKWGGIRPASSESPGTRAVRIPQLSPTQGNKNNATALLKLAIFYNTKPAKSPPKVLRLSSCVCPTGYRSHYSCSQFQSHSLILHLFLMKTGEHLFKVTKNTPRYRSVFWQPSVWKSKAHSLYFKLCVFLKKKKRRGVNMYEAKTVCSSSPPGQ